MAHSQVVKEHMGYNLQSYETNPDNYLQIFKARPYDDADYYWGYTFNQMNWRVVYKGKLAFELNNQSFEETVEHIDKLNKDIKSKMVHN